MNLRSVNSDSTMCNHPYHHPYHHLLASLASQPHHPARTTSTTTPYIPFPPLPRSHPTLYPAFSPRHMKPLTVTIVEFEITIESTIDP